MPDITMCFGYDSDTNTDCPRKDSCYRYTATPTQYRQSYFTEAPFIEEPDGTSCDYFWSNKDENR